MGSRPFGRVSECYVLFIFIATVSRFLCWTRRRALPSSRPGIRSTARRRGDTWSAWPPCPAPGPRQRGETLVTSSDIRWCVHPGSLHGVTRIIEPVTQSYQLCKWTAASGKLIPICCRQFLCWFNFECKSESSPQKVYTAHNIFLVR